MQFACITTVVQLRHQFCLVIVIYLVILNAAKDLLSARMTTMLVSREIVISAGGPFLPPLVSDSISKLPNCTTMLSSSLKPYSHISQTWAPAIKSKPAQREFIPGGLFRVVITDLLLSSRARDLLQAARECFRCANESRSLAAKAARDDKHKRASRRAEAV